MGLFNKLLRSIPGSPLSVAKTMFKIYDHFITDHPSSDKRDALRYALDTRYQVLKTMKQHEIEQCLEFCDDLGEVVFCAVAKENPIAAKQPHVRETVQDLYNYFLSVAPEESSGLKEMLRPVSVGMEVSPFL